MGIELGGNEPQKITMRKQGNNFATQGPCPDGFHVPSNDERVALIAAMTALGIDTSNGNCMKTYLKMPFAGYRNYSSAGVYNQGTYAFYWSSTASSADYAYNLYFDSAGLYPQNGNDRSHGFSVRCFKNEPVTLSLEDVSYYDPRTQYPIIPGYETLYWTGQFLDGVFRDETNGIITIGKDTLYPTATWITIADKNLGATTVYNDGDTLSQANCGNYYQWGNNYGFPRTGTVTTSSTGVDASNYGPGNYYSSSTFITKSMWDSSLNNNLRGGEDGNVPMLEEKEIKKIVIYPDGVTEKIIRPTKREYSYDFMNKTTTQLTNDGWTNASSLLTGAYGVSANNWTAIDNSISGIGTAMETANKLRIEMTTYNYGGGGEQTAGVLLLKDGDGYTQTGCYLNLSAYEVLCGYVSTISGSLSNYTGKVTIICEFDFINKTCYFKLPGKYDNTVSITDSGIAIAKTTNGVRCPLYMNRYLEKFTITIS